MERMEGMTEEKTLEKIQGKEERNEEMLEGIEQRLEGIEQSLEGIEQSLEEIE